MGNKNIWRLFCGLSAILMAWLVHMKLVDKVPHGDPTALLGNNKNSVVSANNCPSGKEGNVWFLGEVGLDFNNGGPVPLHGFANRVSEGYSSICNSNGDLVLYFDGRDIYNSNHQKINTGGEIILGPSTTQSLLLNLPGSDSLYFLFYANPHDEWRDSSMYYAVIDISANGGQGGILTQDQRLIYPTTEKMTAVRHCNKKDWWILGLETFTNRFYSFLLTESGIDLTATVISTSGWDKSNLDKKSFQDGQHGAFQMKLSHDGSMLAVAYAPTLKDSVKLELHDFNCQTGAVSNGRILLDTVNEDLYGVEFSPDNSKLYVGIFRIYQYDLLAGDLEAIRNSKSLIYNSRPLRENSGCPTLGPNGKIYLTTWGRDSNLHVIHEPNKKGVACNFEYQGFELGSRTYFANINLPSGIHHPYQLYSRGPDTLCMDSTAWFYLTDPCPHPDLSWELPPEAFLVDQKGDSVLLRFTQPGKYELIPKEVGSCGIYSDTLIITVNDCSPSPLDTCLTGNEGNVWFLGEVGLDFNSRTAVSRPGFATRAGETQTSISDKNGNLLMYFDGEDLYDASHNIMQGGNNLNPGGRSSTQSLFLKQPEGDSIFYLFYPERFTGTDSPARDTTKSLWYSIIDINMNGGLGGVISNKIRILQPSTEKVTAIPHCNGKDYWIIGSEGGSNRFFSWLLDKDSLHQNSPIISSSGMGNDGRGVSKAAYLKPSHDGRQICEIIPGDNETNDKVVLHFFNSSSGALWRAHTLIERTQNTQFYGCEFSPNNSKLYLTGYNIWQLDLWAGDVSDIRNSLQLILNPKGNIGAPTLGPDGIIYITKFSSRSTTLFTIEEPNLLGQNCQSIEFGFDLKNGTGLGAPNFPAGFLFPEKLYTRYPDTTICMDSVISVWVTGPCDHHNTSWSLLDGGQMNVVHEDSVQLTFDVPGTYRVAVQAESRCGMRNDTVSLQVKDCNCSVFAGTMEPSLDTFNICSSDSQVVGFNNDQVLSPDDTLVFVLHDRSDDTVGNIAATFDNPLIFYRGGLNYDHVYYFSAIAGQKSGQNIDIDDPCLSVSPGLPIIFRQLPELAFISIPTEKCADSCFWVNAEFSGVAPFTFQVRKARQQMGRPIPAEYKTALVNQISFLWCQDTLDLGNITSQYCSSSQIDTTVAIHSIALPQINSLNFAKNVCSGDSTVFSFASAADSVVLINQENTLEKTINTSNITLGPFFADSCFTLKVFNSLGCQADTSFCIQVIDLSSSRDTLYKCPDDTLTLPGGLSVFAVGEYPVILQSTAGCDSNVIFQINNFTPIGIQVISEMACPDENNGVAELIQNSGSGPFSVLWPDGDTSTIRTELKAGQYQVTVFDVNSCSSIIDVVVQEEDRAFFSISTNDESCLGDQDGWIALGSNSASFLFQGVSFSSGDTITKLGGGNYNIEVISPSGLCQQDTVVSIQKGEELLIILPSEIQLSGTTVELPLSITQGVANSYSWTPADFLSCVDCARPLTSPTSDMIYTVRVLSENGCEAAASIRVLVNTNIFIPTSFTPNGDNINDMFRPYFSNPDQIYHMEIYNRWGELMYRCEGNDCVWDGAFEGEMLMPGVFVFVIQYDGEAGREQIKGSATLL